MADGALDGAIADPCCHLSTAACTAEAIAALSMIALCFAI